MDAKYDFKTDMSDRIAYVRRVQVADLPLEVQEQAEGLTQLYSLHDANGEQLALVRERRMAFMLARQNDLAPMSVH